MSDETTKSYHDYDQGKVRTIQEYVPGKQVTLLHVIAQPVDEVYDKLGLPHDGAIGILTLTPGETAIIAGDIATKSGEVRIGFLDRFTGALVITGDVASVTSSLKAIIDYFENVLGYAPAPLTKS
ncbi:MAG: BMC domain-containing protein [Bacillota bacterium]|nr:BMC domain-containing protein [Bacillota bacterium]